MLTGFKWDNQLLHRSIIIYHAIRMHRALNYYYNNNNIIQVGGQTFGQPLAIDWKMRILYDHYPLICKLVGYFVARKIECGVSVSVGWRICHMPQLFYHFNLFHAFSWPVLSSIINLCACSHFFKKETRNWETPLQRNGVYKIFVARAHTVACGVLAQTKCSCAMGTMTAKVVCWKTKAETNK